MPHTGRGRVHELAPESKNPGGVGIKVTHHEPISWLNAAALRNIQDMSWTLVTFHFPMSWLNFSAPWNIPNMFWTNILNMGYK